MSKKRKQLLRKPGLSESATERRALPLPPALRRLSLPIFLALLACYILIFLTAPAPDRLVGPADSEVKLTRIDMLRWLAAVRLGQLADDWTGQGGGVSLFDRAGVLAVAAGTLLIALVIGWLLLDLICRDCGLASLEVFGFSLAVGLNALSLLTLAIGLLGLSQFLVAYVVPIVLVLVLAGWRWWNGRTRRLPSQDVEMARQEPRPPDSSLALRVGVDGALWLAAPFVLVIIAGAMLPPKEFDVREYHLQAPKEWVQQGGITFMPHNVYANMPLGPQILAMPAMAVMSVTPVEHPWWWGALVGKVLLASYSIITMLALFTAGRRFFNPTAGVAAALVYISIPWIAFVSIEGYVDGALACYAFLAVYAVMLGKAHQPEAPARRAVQSTFDGTPRRRFGFVLLAGFLAGAAVSCKYTGVVFVALPLAVWILAINLPLLAKRERRLSRREGPVFAERKAALSAGVFLIAVLAGCGLWLGKNWVLAGNPTYPLAYSVFGGKTRTAEKDAQWRRAHAVPTDEAGKSYSPQQIAAAARQITFDNNWPSPILAPLAALGLFIAQERKRTLILLGWMAVIVGAWFLLTHRIDRFWLPALPFAALLAGVGFTWRGDVAWKWIAGGVLVGGLVWNLLVIVGMLAPPKLFADLASLKSDADRIHPAKIYLNEHVPAGKQVLLVGDAEPFDLQVAALYNTCFDNNVFESLVKQRTGEQRREALREQNISHVYVNWGEIERYRHTYGYTDFVTPEILHELVQQRVLHAPHVISHPQMGAVEVYELVNEED